ncbi:MAG: efflux RND transporter permease subunit, partial [Burkholderiales bacterium]
YKVAFDNTKFIEKSLANVLATLRDACILVVLVVFLFLQKGKATLIPILTIPVSIIGTFAGMYLAGFSINNLTLFGLILSIGIVVDDSIVVIENVERIMRDYKLNAKQASIQTMQEVAGALIAIVLVLCCAFVPSAFLTGLTGILYRQFALTISIAVIISGVTALTLTPALCAILLKNSADFQVTNRFFLRFNQWLNDLTDNYITLLRHMIQHKLSYMLIFSLILISSGIIYSIVPIGFIPNEDKGFFTTQITLPNNASLARTTAVTQSYVKYLLQDKTITNNIAMIGIDQLNSNGEKANAATVISTLADWDLRDTGVDQLINAANTYGAKQKAANFVA